MNLFRHNHSETPYIRLDTRKCEACWKCIDKCHKNVIGKVDFLGHRHAHIDNADKCTGCLKCVKTCEFKAYTAKNNYAGKSK